MPVPPSVPPALTVRLLAEVISPLTASVPPLMLTGPAKVLVPVSVHTELSTLSKAPKPWYCAAGPICDTSKLAVPVPPSWNVSAPVPSTRPEMAEPGASVSVLPVPANWIAAVPPLMVPALKIDEPPLPARIPTAEAPAPAVAEMVPKFVTLASLPALMPKLWAPAPAPTIPEMLPEFVTLALLPAVIPIPTKAPTPAIPEMVPEFVTFALCSAETPRPSLPAVIP